VSTAVNNRQVVVALTGGEIVYFEMTDQLNEYTDRKDMNHEVVAMALQRVSENETRTRFLAIALTDKTVRIVSLDPKDCLTPLSMQAFNAPAYSLSFVKSLNQVVSLNVGLENGLFLRTVLDNESGDLSDTNIRYLGNSNAPVRVVNYQEDCLIALNEGNNWFVDKEGHLTPLDYQVRLLNASGFNSSLSEGIVAVDSTQLLILQLDMTTGMNHVRKEKLDFTPRKLVDVKLRGYCVIENSRSPNEGGKGSVIRLLNKELKTANKVLLQSNEDAVSLMTMVDAHGRSLVLVGVALNLILNPRSSTGGCIHVYEVTADLELQLLHVTLTDEVPYAICDYSTNSNLIIASILNNLWVYEIGKKMLLKKNQIKGPSRSIINNMTRKGRRIFVSTVSEGVFFVDTQDWSIIAEDCRSRYTTAMTVLDYSTLVVGDKFGNVSVVRLEEEDETIKDKKLKILCTFYVGETLTVLKMTTLSLQECIVYATLSGSIGVLIPFKSKDDQDLLNHLEMHLRQQPTLSGRDHRDFRSYYEPVKNVIDGDLCETYIKLDFKKQKDIAEQMDRTVNDITNKLDTLRAQHAF
jgi:splicing factor 3B subunit 3